MPSPSYSDDDSALHFSTVRIYTTTDSGTKILDSSFLLNAYCNGYFPMADGPDGEIHWFLPERRGIIPLDGLIVSRSLRRSVRKKVFHIRIDSAIESTIRNCANRSEVWISETIVQSYLQLARMGYVHTVESWSNDTLVGGLYGVAIGGAFFGESMFSTVTDASKVALVALVKRLNDRGYRLLDTQYINNHLATLGCVEISKEDYVKRLEEAVALPCTFR